MVESLLLKTLGRAGLLEYTYKLRTPGAKQEDQELKTISGTIANYKPAQTTWDSISKQNKTNYTAKIIQTSDSGNAKM